MISGEDHQNTEGPREEYVEERHSFDELAKGIANGALFRGQLLKLEGGAVLESVLGGALPGVAVAKKKKKKKKHHHRAPSPTPSMCSAGDAAACNPCGTSSTSGHPCECITDIMDNPVCYDTQSGGQPCNSNAQCLAVGELCLALGPCGGTGFECLRPCS